MKSPVRADALLGEHCVGWEMGAQSSRGGSSSSGVWSAGAGWGTELPLPVSQLRNLHAGWEVM